jgi:quinol-cytochrome oxidoreductase complex cytochrome b subunit
MSVPPSIECQSGKDPRILRSIPFLPHFVLRDLFAWTAVLALLAALSTFYPSELGAKADPFAAAPAGIRPEWYFLWTFETLKYVPPTLAGVNGELLAICALAAGALGAFLLPVIVPHSVRSERVTAWLGLTVLAFMGVMTALAVAGAAP